MKNKIIIIIFIFLGILYSFANTKEYNLEFDGKNDKLLTLENENEIAIVTINLSQVPAYTKLLVSGTKNINYVISVFSNEKRDNRIQLAQSVYKMSTLYVNKKQCELKVLYAEIECSTFPCSYNLTIRAEEKIILDENEQLYYYVTENNKNMDFMINIKSEEANVWSRGSKLLTNNLSNYITKSKNGNFFIVTPQKIEFTVSASVGDIINVGSIGYTGDSANEIFNLDEKTISLFLSRNEFPQACFNFKLREKIDANFMFFIEGIIDKKIMKMNAIKDSEETEFLYTDGKFSQEFNTKNLNISKYCFTFPDNDKYPQFNNINEIIVNFHSTLGNTPYKGLYFYEPQINGLLYQRSLIKGEKLAFIGLKTENDFKEINYNLFTKNGFPNMTIYDCDNYPLCLYREDTLKNGVSPRNIDQFTTYSIYTSDLKIDFNPISKNQKLLVVECNPGSLFLKNYCKFDTLIFSNVDKINILEDQYFNQYLLEGETDNFKINFVGEKEIIEVNIDIMAYVGDIEIITNSTDGNKYKRYHSSNKYFINIILGDKSENINDITFKVNAKKDSYYTILINYIRNEKDSSITEKLLSGMNYLVTIDPLTEEKDIKAEKIIKIKNEKMDDLLLFMVNFNSLNCKLDIYKRLNVSDVSKEYSSIDKFDYCFEDVLDWYSDDRYYQEYYEYKIIVQKEDLSKYNDKLCMLYMSSIEIYKNHEIYGRDIIIPDNILHQIIFTNKIQHLSYGYVHVDNEVDLLIQFNVIHKAEYNVKIFCEYTEKRNYKINSNNVIYLKNSEWQNECPEENELCYIIIDITLEKSIDVQEPLLELSIKSVDADTTAYIPKNVLKKDYINNKKVQHYYTEIGQNEVGFILVDFYLNNGKIFARIVKKNSEISEEGADWEGKYKFPKSEEESLYYDSFTKKINFNTKENDCQNGCYLLISILSNEEKDSNIFYGNYPFSVVIQSSPEHKTIDDFPIRIPIDEYIFGNIDILKDENMKDYYSVIINYDADNILIELQSEMCGLVINIGNNKPTTLNADFIFLSEGRDLLINITKQQIISKIKEKDTNFQSNSIKDIVLTFGLYTYTLDSVYTSVYSFKVHLESNSQYNIHKVKSNRKNICDTENVNDSNYPYRCLFVIQHNFIGQLNDLLLYAKLEDKSSKYEIYADYIDSSLFEISNKSNIENIIPTNNSLFSTHKTKLNYLYLPDGLNNEKYLLVNVVSTKNTRVELLSTFHNYLETFIPSSVNPQLYLVKNDKLLTLDFQHEKALTINLISIIGNAEIYWENNPNKYYLQGEEDRLTLTSPKDYNKKLIIKTTNTYLKNENDIGFIFYLAYTIKTEKNINEFIIGDSVNFIYPQNDFPIILYSRLDNIEKDLDIFFTFYEMENENNFNIYNKVPIKASITLVKQKTIYDIKSNNGDVLIDSLNSVGFIYEPSLRTGFIRFTKEQIKNNNINQNDNPYLYIKIEKTSDEIMFKRLNLEITANQEDLLYPINENIYQYGELNEKENKKEYILKNNLKNKNIVFEFSSLNDNILFNLTDESENIVYEKINEKYKNGKKIYIFKIDSDNNLIKLIISIINNSNKEYYTFKYYSIENDKKYIDYSIENDELSVERQKSKNGIDYKIILDPITNTENLKINYIVKFVNNKDNYFPNQSIAILGGDENYIKEFNNILSNNNKITLEIKDIKGLPTYIQVVAQINDKGINEFLSYKYYILPQDDPEEESSNTLIIIISVIIIVIIIITLIVIIFMIRRRKNKDLVNDINKIDNQKGLIDEKKEYELS